jgi:hypothetical protein
MIHAPCGGVHTAAEAAPGPLPAAGALDASTLAFARGVR